MEIVEHPKSYFKIIVHKTILNDWVITTGVQKALEAFRESEYKQFGQILGRGMMNLDSDLSN